MTSWKLLEGIGVELEYMIVQRETLDVLPVADRILESFAGATVGYVELGDIALSNELALHVIEMKTNGPVVSLNSLAQKFSDQIGRINSILAESDACLMPSAVHPWMDPLSQTVLWPHECGPIYQTFNRIFDCRGHGWSNLQSIHLNLSFDGDEEFGRLHTAIRILMPIMPALAAASPIIDGVPSSHLDTRLKFYSTNSARIPEVAGRIIPEQVFTRADYQKIILEPMFRAIAPLDPEGLLSHEFLNARGAIARFERGAIEIRVLDIQETPAADLAACQLILSALKMLTEKGPVEQRQLMAWGVDPLAGVFRDVIRDADLAVIADGNYLELFGLREQRVTAGDLWRHIAGNCPDAGRWDPRLQEALAVILGYGPLARRIHTAVAGDYRRDNLREVYGRLCRCLAEDRMFIPGH